MKKLLTQEKLLTQKDLAERWQVTVDTIKKYRQDGIITPIKGLPAIRFNPQHILDLEETKLDKFSPIERRKLEREKEELENKINSLIQENSNLKNIISNVLSVTSQAITL